MSTTRLRPARAARRHRPRVKARVRSVRKRTAERKNVAGGQISDIYSSAARSDRRTRTAAPVQLALVPGELYVHAVLAPRPHKTAVRLSPLRKRAGYKASQPFARSKEADAFAPQPCQEPGYVYAFAAYPCMTCAAVRAFGKYVHRRIGRKREYHYNRSFFRKRVICACRQK